MPLEAAADLIARARARAPTAELDDRRSAFLEELLRSYVSSLEQPNDFDVWRDGTDVVGTAYERLLDRDERRPLGQFQTPFWAADVMAGWILSEPTMELLDPGVGAGRLLFRALRAATQRVTAIGLDVDPVCLAMADLNLRLRGSDEHVLRRTNFLLDPCPFTPDAVICNPPYSRHRAIPQAERVAIHSGFEERLGVRFGRRTGLHALFLVRAMEIAAEGARIAFITPADWLEPHYGREIKRWVLERARVEAIIAFPHDRLVFDNVLTTTSITLLRKGASEEQTARLIRIDETPPAPSDVLAAVQGAPTAFATEEVRVSPTTRWIGRVHKRGGGTPLVQLARIRRGIATGSNKFFVLSEAARRSHGIDRSDLRPCIASPRVVEGVEITAEQLEALADDVPRWLLSPQEAVDESSDTALAEYLRLGRRIGAADTYLAQSRRPWYMPEHRDDCPILFTYFNRSHARFIRNRASAIPLNTFLIVEPHEGVDPDELCDALNGVEMREQLAAIRRIYGRGLWKLEPSELGQMSVPVSAARRQPELPQAV